jgi:hypothetical protein
MNRAFARLGIAALILGLTAHAASADTVITNPFSIGYNFNRAGSGADVWVVQSPSDAATQGLFNFEPVIVATATSGTNAGPIFTNRVLADGTSTSGAGRAYQFSTTVTGSYRGRAPKFATDAANPHYHANLDLWRADVRQCQQHGV